LLSNILKSLGRPEYQVSQPCECGNLFSKYHLYALLSKKLVEESKRYQYLKTEVKQSNTNGILPNSLNIAKLVLVLLAPSIYLQK
jgi:hypothetical protein